MKDTSGRRFRRSRTCLLCSDGLHGLVPDDKIADILKQTSNLGVSALTLIRAALGAGGPDNVTVILAQYGRTE